MKKELKYFEIEGAYGGNQEWFSNVVMYIGGCAAATACDSSIYFAKYKGMERLYPFDLDHLNKDDYKKFSQIMKPYIRPRKGGVKNLEWFIDGFSAYIRDYGGERGTKITMKGFSGEHTSEEAREFVRGQIDREFPVPCLLLKHQDTEQFKDYIWHWFLITGYEENTEQFYVQTATYGQKKSFLLEELWNTGFSEKGGFIEFSLYEQKNIRYNKI